MLRFSVLLGPMELTKAVIFTVWFITVKGHRPGSAEGKGFQGSIQRDWAQAASSFSSGIVEMALVIYHCWERAHTQRFANQGLWEVDHIGRANCLRG